MSLKNRTLTKGINHYSHHDQHNRVSDIAQPQRPQIMSIQPYSPPVGIIEPDQQVGQRGFI
jgi:hypothetical protein